MGEGHQLKKLTDIVHRVNSFEDKIAALSDDDLKHQTVLFKQRIDRGESLDSLLPEAFATEREAAKRVLGMRPFDVQFMGGTALRLNGTRLSFPWFICRMYSDKPKSF